MSHSRNQRRKPPPLLRLGRRQRQRPHRPPVKRTEEGDHVLPLGMVARQLERALHRLRSRVAVVNAMRPRHGRNLRQPRRQFHHAFVIKIGPRHVDQFARLLLNRSHHVRMAMSGRSHGNARGKIKKLVAIHIGHNDAASALGHQRIRPRIRRRNIFLIALKHALGVGPRQGGLDLRSDCGQVFVSCHCCSGHNPEFSKANWSGYDSVCWLKHRNDSGFRTHNSGSGIPSRGESKGG